jgi:hypothetical protein
MHWLDALEYLVVDGLRVFIAVYIVDTQAGFAEIVDDRHGCRFVFRKTPFDSLFGIILPAS